MAVRRADIGKPYSRVGLINVVAVFCSTLSAERQSRLPFRDLRPGPDFIRNFISRNDERLRLGRPAKESEQRWRAYIADCLTTHLDVFEKQLHDDNVDASRLYNLDETGITPNKDTSGRLPCRHVLRSGKSQSSQLRQSSFFYIHRITMMATVCADGTKFSPLFVIKREKFRTVSLHPIILTSGR